MKIVKIIGLLLGMVWLMALGGKDPYEIINKQSQLEESASAVKIFLAGKLGMGISGHLKLYLVSDKELDQLYSGSFRGAEIGLYKYEGGNHLIYVMKDRSRDETEGILAHEMAHAWQTENCPSGQSEILREGFAEWVSYKLYDYSGAYKLMQNMRESQEPVYSVGLHAMLVWEDKYGVKGVIERVKSQKDLPPELNGQ